MPQSNHKTLIRVLLWWVVLLSVCQAALLVLFFTMGHFGKSPNRDANESPIPSGSHSDPTYAPENIAQAIMFTYKANGVHSNNTITWYGVNPNYPPIDDGQLGDLIIQKDGNFFVCLRITLRNSTCRNQDRCPQVEVTLKEVKGKTDILTGWINDKTLSTGLLCKVEKLLEGNRLRVEIKPLNIATVQINTSQSHSSLDLIYIKSE